MPRSYGGGYPIKWSSFSFSLVFGKLCGTTTTPNNYATIKCAMFLLVPQFYSPNEAKRKQEAATAINWFWPCVAVRVPIIPINLSFRPTETIWGHDNDFKRNNPLFSISVSFISTVPQETKQSTPCFGRTRQPCAATTTPNATTNSSFRKGETISYNNEDNKQQRWWQSSIGLSLGSRLCSLIYS